MQCPNCGEKVHRSDTICPSCGEPLSSIPFEETGHKEKPAKKKKPMQAVKEKLEKEKKEKKPPTPIGSRVLKYRLWVCSLISLCSACMYVPLYIIFLISGILSLVNIFQLFSLGVGYLGGFFPWLIVLLICVILLFPVAFLCFASNAVIGLKTLQNSKRVLHNRAAVIGFYQWHNLSRLWIYVNLATFGLSLLALICCAIVMNPAGVTLHVFLLIATAIGILGSVLTYLQTRA